MRNTHIYENSISPLHGVDLVKHVHVRGDMKNLWIMFDHVKCLKDWTTEVYTMCMIASYSKVPTIACCETRSEDYVAQTLVMGKLEFCRGGEWNVKRKI